MNNIFIFSDKLRIFGKILKFKFQIVGRWIYILFSWKRKLKQISFNYLTNWHFDNAYLVVDIAYKNGIWYKIGNFKSILSNEPIVIDLANIGTDSLEIEVHGFFQKEILFINLNKIGEISSESFRTIFSNLKEFQINSNKITIQLPKPKLTIKKPQLELSNINVNTSEIEINHKPFKTQDYI